MKRALRIDERLYREVEEAATRQGVAMTRFVEEALRLELRRAGAFQRRATVALPTYAAGDGFPYSPLELKKLILG